MRNFYFSSVSYLLSPLLLVSMSACSIFGAPDRQGGDGDGDSSSGGDGDTGRTTSTSATGDGDGDSDSGGDGDFVAPIGVVLPDGSGAKGVIPARIRRLTNAEYNATVQALIGTQLTPASTFPPDMRQRGFTVNEAQRVDPVLARQLDTAATALADEVVSKIDSFAPCDGDKTACANTFIETFGEQAYRRPLSDDDVAALMGLFEVGYADGEYAEGIRLVVRGMLQSPGFLYHTEIGDTSDGEAVVMTAREIAASMAYLFTGAPPDDALIQAAEAGSLATAEGRASEARRLITSSAGQNRAVQIVREWLGIDRITVTAKDATAYPSYEGLRNSMNQETETFVKAVLDSSAGSVQELLGAPWTVANSDLVKMYNGNGEGRVDVPDRPGLLNRAAFLSVYSHAQETSPVMRGAAVLRRIDCFDIEFPASLAVQIVAPPPDPTQTTRQRFSIHSQDAVCAECHNRIDPLGFSFEQFDGMGAFRTTETEQNHPIDSATEVASGADYDGPYTSSTELTAALAVSDHVRECFARYMFRANVAEGTSAKSTEDGFIDSWAKLEPGDQQSLVEIMIQFATSDLSVYRSQP